MSVRTPNLREPVYHPPELRSQPSTFGNEIDMWAFGCILFEMVTQRAAFKGEEHIRKLKVGTKPPTTFNIDYRGVDREITRYVRWTEMLVEEIMQVDPKRRPFAESILRKLEVFV